MTKSFDVGLAKATQSKVRITLLKEDPTIATHLRHEPYCQVNTLSILGSKAIQTRILVNPLKFLSNLQSARKGLKSGVLELINGGIKSRRQI